MPREVMRGILGSPPRQPAARFDDQALSEIAARFRVSQHAMLIRLVHLGYVNANYYWGVKRPLFDRREAEFKSRARARYYGSRYKSSVGDLYTGLVLEAWNSGRITNHNAAEYMGIKNFEHLYDIRANFDNS
jgi:Zn-dependent peptidase ImmA (M78 family)